MYINEKELSQLVKNVILEMNGASAPAPYTPSDSKKQIGVFDTMEEALAEANKAYTLFKHYNKEQREKIIEKIRELTRLEAETLAETVSECWQAEMRFYLTHTHTQKNAQHTQLTL